MVNVMADMADIVVYNDATTPVLVTLEPYTANPFPIWVEKSATKAKAEKVKISQTRMPQKNGYTRRMHKVELPIMEVPSGGTPTGYVAPAEVAHVVSGQLVVFVHERATDTDVANALKYLINSFLAVTTAGTGNEYKNATDFGRKFLVGDIMPD